MRREDFIFADREGAQLQRSTGEVSGNSFKLARLRNCTVRLFDHLGSVYIDDCEDCELSLGPSDGSVFVRRCCRITLSAAAQQVRLTSCEDVRLFVFSLTGVAVESCRQIELAPYNCAFPQIRSLSAEAGLLGKANRGAKFHNFTPNGEEPCRPLEPPDAALSWEVPVWDGPLAPN